MGQWQIKDKETDQVIYRYEADESWQGKGKFGWQWDDPDQERVVHEAVPQETLSEEAQQQKWDQLRAQRNAKLITDIDETKKYMDWDEIAGTPWSTEDKAAWAAYRQDLLDVPNDVSDIDALDLESFVWPEKPE